MFLSRFCHAHYQLPVISYQTRQMKSQGGRAPYLVGVPGRQLPEQIMETHVDAHVPHRLLEKKAAADNDDDETRSIRSQ